MKWETDMKIEKIKAGDRVHLFKAEKQKGTVVKLSMADDTAFVKWDNDFLKEERLCRLVREKSLEEGNGSRKRKSISKRGL